MTCNQLRKGAMVGLGQFAFLLSLTCPLRLTATDPPKVTSVFPLGGQQGSTYAAEVRGQNLDKAYTVWFDCEDLRGRIEKVEPDATNSSKGEKGEEDKP